MISINEGRKSVAMVMAIKNLRIKLATPYTHLNPHILSENLKLV